MDSEFAISVIIPIFGVEKYIRRCTESLMKQTLNNVEFIFIDDCTKDRSMEIVDDVVSCFENRTVRILHHEVNKGLPAARNTGLAVANGEYIFHCDSDDFIEPTMLEKLWITATKNDADIVYCDWFLSFNDNERYMKQHEAQTGRQALKLALEGSIKYNVWNKIIRKSLYVNNKIAFPVGHAMGEDMTIIKLLACADRVSYIQEALYHYIRVNTSAMTQLYTDAHLESLQYNVKDTECFIRKKVRDNQIDEEIAFFKLNTKLPFLISADSKNYKLWCNWFTEADKWIWKNKSQAFRTRFIQWSACKKLFFINRAYYYFVIKFIYGVIYK